MGKSIEKYTRNAVCCHLDEFDPIFASEADVIEVCEWKNGEGYDIAINDKTFSFTHGEFEAITYLIAQLNNE